MDFEVTPLFASPVAVTSISENMERLNLLKTEKIWAPSGDHWSHNSSATRTVKLLDEFPEEKSILNRYFQKFLAEVVGYGNIPFKMTTSWGTRLLTGGHSQKHIHKNCLYSGVFYLDEVVEGGAIQFANNTFPYSSTHLGRPTHWTPFSGNGWIIQPRPKTFVIFPSNMEHAVLPYHGKEPRYSVAMNWAPEGRFGVGDSQVNLSLHNDYNENGDQTRAKDPNSGESLKTYIF